jgi:outer membrane receptor protein involved in Fe transport
MIRIGFFLALPALGSVAFAQGTPTPPPADEEVVTLSAFTVSTNRDVGYKAANSVAGTRTNTPIRDVPMNIQVFTKDLADDLLIKNQVDFEAYNAALVNGGADRFTDNVIQQSYQNFLFRGFRQNWGLRDGVREYDPIDTQGLARVEVVKGPAAALYGLAYPGGVMNNISKVVEFQKSFTNLRLTAGAEGDWRTSLDTNVVGTLKGNQKVGLRFNGAYEKTQDSREHSEGDIRFSSLQFAWQPTTTTQVEFLAEQGYRAKPNGLGWFTTGEAGIDGNQASIPLQVLKPEIPWTWNWANGLNNDSLDTSLYRGRITQQIGENLQVQAYVQYSSRLEKSGNGWDANGSGGADSWESANSGWDQATNTIRSTYHYRDWGNQMHAYGATGVYKLDLPFVKNTFAFGSNVWKEDELSRNHSPLNPLASLISYPVANNVPVAAPIYPPSDVVPVMTGDGYHHEDNSNDYYFLNWQASWLDQRLKTNVGINRTNLKTVAWNNGSSAVADNVYKASQNSPLFGAVFDITKEVSVFLVHSTSLFPDSTKDSFGNQFSPQVGKSIEGGVKVELLNGKISGTVSYYQIKQTGGTQSDPNKVNRNTVRYDSLTPDQRQIEFGGIRPLGDIIEGGEQESKGFDVDLVFQPFRQWQIVTSFTHVDHEFTESAVPATIGQTYPQAIKDRWALLTKYSFTEGSAKGLSLGLGIAGGSKALVDYQRRAPNGAVYSGSGSFIDVARYEPGRTTAEVFGIYRFKLANQDAFVQLNVKNLLETPDYIGWKATGSKDKLATERYEIPTPIVIRVTLGFDF